MSGWGAAAAAAADEPQGVHKPGVTDAPANASTPNSTSPPAAAPLSQSATGATPPAGGASAKNPAPGQPAPAQPPAAPPPPVVLTPAKRGGLAGLVDDMANVLSGKTTPELAKGSDGNVYVKQQTLTRGQQWMKIAANAFKGAAAGLAAGKGAGNQGQALEAGVQASEKAGQQQQQQQKEMTQEARQQNLDNANYQMLQMQKTEQAWKAARLKVEASQHDIEFFQQQEKRLTDAGGTVLGPVEHAGDIAGVLKVNPDLMADMIKRHQIQTVPNVNPDGSMGGMTVIKMPAGFRQQLLPAGAIFHTFDAMTGQYIEHKASDPMTAGEQEDYDSTAAADALKFKNDKDEADLKAAQTQEAAGRAAEVPSEIAKNLAEANKNRLEAATGGTSSSGAGSKAIQDDIAEGLASGRYLMGKDLPLRTTKDQATAAQYTKAADDFSLSHYGLHYSPEIIRQESRMAESPHTQAFLTGIDRMIGTPADPGGQLNQVLDLAKKAGVGENAPLQQAKLWIKQKLGFEAQKNFEQALSDTQTALGTLIGNPLLGSGESDLKLKTAQKQFGSNPTMSDLIGAVQTTRNILERARGSLARNNRYIQQRYGETLSPAAPSQVPAQAQTPATATPAGMVTVRLANGQTGQIPQANVQNFQQDNPGASVVQ